MSDERSSTARPFRILLIDILKQGGKEVRSYINYRWLNVTLALSIRAMRKQRGWSQAELAKRADLTAITIVRIEKLYWGKNSFSLSTLKNIAAAFDVALVGRFCAWSELIDQMTNTAYTQNGLSPETFNIPTFEEEMKTVKLQGPQ